MDAVIRGNLLRKILNLKADHFHDRGLATPPKFIHVRNDNPVENLTASRSAIPGNAKNANLLDERRPRIMRLQFFRINVFAIRKNDHILTPAGNGEMSAGIDESEISGMEPTVLDGLRRLLRVMVITLHHDGPANPYLADASVIGRVDEDGDTANRFPNRADTVVIDRCDGG